MGSRCCCAAAADQREIAATLQVDQKQVAAEAEAAIVARALVAVDFERTHHLSAGCPVQTAAAAAVAARTHLIVQTCFSVALVAVAAVAAAVVARPHLIVQTCLVAVAAVVLKPAAVASVQTLASPAAAAAAVAMEAGRTDSALPLAATVV